MKMRHVIKCSLAIMAAGLMSALVSLTPAQGQDAPKPATPAPAAPAPVTPAPAAAAAPAAAPAAPAAKVDTPDSEGTILNSATINGGNSGTALDLQWPVPADSSTVNPAGKDKVTTDEIIQNVAHNKVSINLVWTLVTGFLVFFMQLGFALLETGLVRAKNASHTMGMNIGIYALGVTGFWICGFAFMFGGYYNGPVNIGWQPTLGQGLSLLNQEYTVHLFGHDMGVLGHKGFFLGSDVFDTAIMTLFLFEMVFMDTAATIPTGAMAERWNFKNFIIYGVWVGMFPYAIYGNWVWGGGWLAQLGQNFEFGHGAVDFAGSGVVHMCGGMMALMGAIVIGPRIGKFGADGRPRAIPGHDIPMVVAGTLILAFGWFGFNPGSTLAGTDNRIAVVAVNTMLASVSGAIGATILMYILTKKPDPTMICNGMLAGLVAITAPCAFVNTAGAFLIGFIAGFLVVTAVFFVERVLKVDDPVGAVSVHGCCGAFGVLAVGLFANGSYGQGWGGVHKFVKDGVFKIVMNDTTTPETTAASLKAYAALADPKSGWSEQGVTGLFGSWFGAPVGDFSQLTAQFIDVCTCFIFIGAFAFLWFTISNFIVPIRSKKEDELQGLDEPEMGAIAYPDFHVSDKVSPL